jgi:hypothetical protein
MLLMLFTYNLNISIRLSVRQSLIATSYRFSAYLLVFLVNYSTFIFSMASFTLQEPYWLELRLHVREVSTSIKDRILITLTHISLSFLSQPEELLKDCLKSIPNVSFTVIHTHWSVRHYVKFSWGSVIIQATKLIKYKLFRFLTRNMKNLLEGNSATRFVQRHRTILYVFLVMGEY